MPGPTFSSTHGRSPLGSVVLQPNFGPYEPLDPPRVVREQFGDLGRVRYTYELVCLKEGCDTAEARGVSDFPSGRLRYRFKDRPGNAFESFDWPLLEVSSRVANTDVEEIRWRSDATSLVPASYRVSARAAALASSWLRSAARLRRSCSHGDCGGRSALTRPISSDDVDTRSALERALEVALLRADDGDLPERRRALERVARELGAAGDPDLAGEARALAWAPTPPTTAQIEALTDRAGIPAVVGETA